MSVKRRLVAAGMPAAGVTIFAALALTGQPASAASVDSSTLAARQNIVAGLLATQAACVEGERIKCDYGNPADTVDDGDTPTDSNGSGTGTGTGTGVDDSGDDTTGSGSGGGGGDDDGRGGDGYGGASPYPSPSTTPSGGTDNVPPGGEQPTTAPPGGAGPDSVPNGNGGGTLPLTGAPMAAITTIGGLLTAAGAALCFGVWYNSRRRRRA
jgi:hypothetical protein